METIFVRKVKNLGPAQQAGLQKGDRIVAVNSIQVIDKPYSFVIQLIQKSPAYLHLLVVPKEEDALQRLFTDTAYNPVSNQSFIPDSPPFDRRSAKHFLTNTFQQQQQQQKPSGLQVDAQFWRSLRYPFGYHPPRIEKRHSYQLDQEKSLPNEIYTEIQIHDIPQRYSNKAQPQVPLYKKMGRRASEGNNYKNYEPYYDLPEYSSIVSDDEMVFNNKSRSLTDNTSQSSANMSVLTYPSSAGCRLSLNDDRRESSSSLTSSYADGSKDSLSSFDSNSTLTGQETDDSAILSRYRKSFQKKEEFLKMPSNPYETTLMQREFYGRPKKLDKPQWPPNESTSSLSPRNKPTHHNFQRVKNDIDTERSTSQHVTGGDGGQIIEQKIAKSPREKVQIARMDYIQEAATAPSNIHFPDNPNEPQDEENKRVCSPTQLVFTRTRQFESGRALPDDDPLLSDRTSFYKSELSKISSKRLVPNVNERAQEYEIRAVDPRRETTTNAIISTQKKILRDSRSLDSSDVLENHTNRLHFRTNSADSCNENIDESKGRKLQRQNTVIEKSTHDEIGQEMPSVVRRRIKNTSITDDERIARRESYLKATEGSRLQFECDFSDGETSPRILRSAHRRWRPPLFPGDIQQLRKLFEDAASSLGGSASGNSSSSTSLEREKGRNSPFEKEKYNLVREGTLNCKITELDGKRPAIRSWRQTWAVLKGPKLFLYKDRNHQSPIGTSDLLEQSLSNGVDIRTSLVRVAEDYTKRKHVLRVSSVNPCRSELLLQAENGEELADWVKVLNEQGATSTYVETKLDLSGNKQQAVPQSIPALTSIQVQGSRLSPQPPLKSKITNTPSIGGRNRSPTGQSPVNKTRKPTQNQNDPNTSPKSKTWRGRVAKQFRKIQGASSPSSPTAPEGSTFGVPLEQCIPSIRNQYVPKFVEVCTDIVDERGLQTVGIYRVPGNNASITALSEEVNKNYEDVPTDDVKWNDVHVVSSLLKSFFRKLPDSLVTNTFYLSFIRADKIDDPKERMKELKRLIKNLPPHNYYTLKHLILHLNRVMDNSEINKMDAKNVAIVFGPNIVRPEEETMADMVSNNSHQCKILVTLLNHANWFFSESNQDFEIDIASIQETYEENECGNQQTLLDSISKLEAMPVHKEKNGALFSSIISAAQRKVKRKTKGPNCLPDNKDDILSPSGTHSLPSFSPRFSPNDLKDNFIENKNVIPTTVRDIETNTKPTGTTERVPWFNYATDQEEFQKRIEKFRNETEAMLTRPRHLEISVDKSSRNSTSLTTATGSRTDYPITKTQSVSNVFSSRIPSTNTFDNRNSLNSIDNQSNTFKYHNNNKNYERNGEQEVHFSSLQIIENNNKKDSIKSGRRNSSIENLNCNNPTNQNAKGMLKKIKYEAVEGGYHYQKTNSNDSMNKCGITDDDTDLVSAMTKLYDKKLEDYTQPSTILTGDGLPYVDESPEKSKENHQSSDKENNKPCDLYKNPSLHKYLRNNNNNNNNNNNRKEEKLIKEQEKDEDSTIKENMVPDNERHLTLTLISNTTNILNGTTNKLKRSESLNKPERTSSPMYNSKIKRSESLNKTITITNNIEKLKRSDSLTKNEKTECNISKKREQLTKRSKELKRKNGMPDRSIKRRHTVGGTKDPDKVTWLDKYNNQQEEINIKKEDKEKNIRTSSPDLSSTRRERLLFEINLIGPENMVVALKQHLIGARPQSFPESRVYKMPLESHV